MSRQVDKFSYSDLFGFYIQNSMFFLTYRYKKRSTAVLQPC